MLRIFIGYDPGEAAAFTTCVGSLIRHASQPLEITPLALNTLPFYRERRKDGSTSFVYSRFLVPYLCGFQGWALYMDCDMLVREDIAKLFHLALHDKDVMVAKHDYRTKHPNKFRGNKNEDFPRKNWSSLILWNCGNYPNRVLTPEFVENQSGHYLHRFQWLNERRIGEVPLTWNWLVSEYPHNDDAKILHYTIGSPCFTEYRDCDHAQEWHSEFQRAITPCE